MQAEYRQRLVNGAYRSAAPASSSTTRTSSSATTAPPTPGYRNFRGASKAPASSRSTRNGSGAGTRCRSPTRPSLQDYNVPIRATPLDPFQNRPTEGISQLYLTGHGDRSYFDARTIYYYGFSEFDNQKRTADHPSGDGLQLHLRPAGARRRTRLQLNLTSLSRDRRLVRSDHHDRADERLAAARPPPIRPSRTPAIACCAACPAPIRASRRR